MILLLQKLGLDRIEKNKNSQIEISMALHDVYAAFPRPQLVHLTFLCNVQ